MNIGIIGLGKMGSAIAYRALAAGHTVVGFDTNETLRQEVCAQGVTVVDTIKDLADRVRIIWLMVPVQVVDTVLKELQSYSKPGDIIVDGGNSFYRDSITRAHLLKAQGITYLDCGTSGGLEGRSLGFCLMVGGDRTAYETIYPLLVAIAAPGGVAHVGQSGVGHYVKMIHNGIEYGLLEAYAEGFELIKEGTFKDSAIDLEQLSRIWNVSSVIRSWLLELTNRVFKHDQTLTTVSGEIAEGGTGRWTVEEAVKNNIRIPVIKSALNERAWSRETGGNYATKLIALLRHEFGGHLVNKVKK